MVRKYKFHRYYAVVWYNRETLRWYYSGHLTKKEADAKFKNVLISESVMHAEIVSQVVGWDYCSGRIEFEAF